MSEEKLYLVAWEIEIPAATPEEAIRTAVKWLVPQEPTRWCYSAQDTETGKVSKHEGEDLF